MVTEPADDRSGVATRLSLLSEELTALLGAETVHRDDDGVGAWIDPRPEACPVSWMRWGHKLAITYRAGVTLCAILTWTRLTGDAR